MSKFFRKIKKIVKKIFKAVVNVFTGFMGAFGMSMDTPEMGGGGNYEAATQGITVNKASNVAGIPVVYGKRKVGGVRTFVATQGTDNQYLYVCLAVAEGEINAFKKIYINDEEQSITSFPIATNVSVPSGSKYYVDGASRATFQFFTGTEDQSVSSLLDEHDDWNSSHRLRGVAYVACKFQWVKPKHNKDNGEQTLFNPWQGIPTIQVEIEGKKVLTNYPNTGAGTSGDPFVNAKDTSADTSTYDSDFESGFSYSTNPADHLMDYLRNDRYGKGLKDNRIDFVAFQKARATCNLSKNFGPFTGNFLESHTHIDVNETLFNNTKKLLQTCRGFLPYTNGKYQLKIETGITDPEDLLILDDSKIIGSISVSSEEKNNKYNTAHITFSNEEKDYESDTVVFTANGEAINGVATNNHLATDGEALTLTMGAPGITKRERVLQYAEYMVERSRKQLQVSFTATSEAQQLVAGDLVSVVHRYETIDEATGTAKNDFLFNSVLNSEATSYSDPKKIFRVTGQKLNYDGTVDLILLEHQNNIYDVRVQAEDRDLSPIQKIKPVLPIWPPRPIPLPIPRPPISLQKFKVECHYNMVGSAKKVQIRTNNKPLSTGGFGLGGGHSDAFATHYIYTLKIGTNQEDKVSPYTDDRVNFYNKINGIDLPFNTQVEVQIYSLYANGNRQLIEKQFVTTLQDPAAVSSGGL